MKRILTVSILVASSIVAWGHVAARAADAEKPGLKLPGTGLKLPGIFADHMVLQREMPVPVWGWAEPGEEVTVSFAGQEKTARAADGDGKWIVKLDPLQASAEPRELKVGDRVFHDVLVGDVWLCSGQSNMGMSVAGSRDADNEIAAGNHPLIREFKVAVQSSLTPMTEVGGKWSRCTPETVGSFSGVAYFFGRELHREWNVPIGLVVSAVGGTPAEAWTRVEALERLPQTGERAKAEIAQVLSQEADNKQFLVARADWEREHGVQPPPVAEAAKGWAAPDLDTHDWKPVTFPGQWRQFGLTSGGVFWIRKEFDLPAEALKNRWLIIGLNWVNEHYETVFLNGEEVARIQEKPPAYYMAQRSYHVDSKLARPGRNVLAIRFVTATERAGMNQRGKDVFANAGLKDVDDTWFMKVESTFPPLPPQVLTARPKPNSINPKAASGGLYNAMIAPLMPLAIKGAVWYQGESNVTRSGEYRDLLTTLIADWRTQSGQEAFPFYIVQLANYYGVPKEPGDSGVARVREAQAQVAKSVPATGLAVAIDIGEESIHPLNKQEVGRRLAFQALRKTYGRDVSCDGPTYRGTSVEGNAIRIAFDHADGLVAREGPPKWFAIAGADQKFVWADATLEGDTILVTSPQVPEPVAVRYAWADNPEGCNLFNSAGLPMAPFRTDDWPVAGTAAPGTRR
jgi:sialate O-acetylesterase